jgi:hypothetical protein
VTVREVPCGFNECQLDDLDVDLSWFCTGIRRIPSHKRSDEVDMPPLLLAMMPVGRRHDDHIAADDDDASEVERAAEEAQEAALEADEG